MKTHGIGIVVLFALLLVLSTGNVEANSMEPPGVVILVEGKGEGLEVYLQQGEQRVTGVKREWITETQFWFYTYEGYEAGENWHLVVTKNGVESTYQLGSLESYHNTFTLSLNNQKLYQGKSLFRSVILVGVRVLSTLMIEAGIFYCFGFRKRESWLFFLFMNIITQGALNLYINSLNVAISYPVIILIVGEFWVFVVETIGFITILSEHTKPRRLSYV